MVLYFRTQQSEYPPCYTLSLEKYMADNNILDSIFKAKEKDTETFADIVKNHTKNSIAEEETIQLKKTGEFKEETQKFISIMHGYHEDNYVWHIRPSHKKKPWAVNMNRVLFAIGKVLSEYIPNDVIIDLIMPNEQWEIEEITVKANGAMTHWAISDETLQRVTGQMFEVLNTLV